jgi:hypothetical protein
MKKRLFAALILTSSIALGGTGIALASPSPNGPGQPSLDCADVSSSPQGFQTPGFANAEAHYAGSDGTHSLNGNTLHAVSQYDVACFQVSSH